MKPTNRYAAAFLMLAWEARTLYAELGAPREPGASVLAAVNATAIVAGALSLLTAGGRSAAVWRMMMLYVTVSPFVYLLVPGTVAKYRAAAQAVAALPRPLAFGTVAVAVAILGVGWAIDRKLHRTAA